MNKPEGIEHGTRAIALLDVRSRRVRVILALGAMALYAAAFIPLYYLAGPAVTVLAILPVAATGWLLGMPAGALAGLLVFPLHILLLSLVGEAGWDLMPRGGLLVSLVVVAMGAIVGGLRDLNERMRRDITDRKRAEEALRESEEKYRTLVQRLDVGVFRRTPKLDGRFLEANPALIRIHGYESEEAFLESDISDLYQDPEDRREFYEEIMREGFVEGRELRLKKADGTTIWTSSTVRLILDKNGEPRYYQGIVQDITERKRVVEELQKRLKELEIYYRATLGRESRIIELKHQVNELLERLGEEKEYLGSDQ